MLGRNVDKLVFYPPTKKREERAKNLGARLKRKDQRLTRATVLCLGILV